MNRAFISLYLFIVSSVVFMGWSFNQLWETHAPGQDASAEIRALFKAIEADLVATPNLLKEARHIAGELQLTLEVLSLDDVANSAAMQQLHKGDLIAAQGDNEVLWYKRLDGSQHVLMLAVPQTDDRDSPLYTLLLIVFYCGIALTIYVWVWPLSRDSKKLERQTRTMGKDGVPQSLNISSRSTLYPLALAFNQMAQRLRELIASYRDMTNAVSHELRTPLARMKFALAMINEENLPEKDRRQLRSLELDIAEMESLISSLLMYAGFEQKSQNLQQTPGKLGNLLQEIQARFDRYNERMLQLTVDGNGHDAVIHCEWKLMDTVLQNLINNAAHHARSRIHIAVQCTPQEYVIAIEDDGPGVPPEKRRRAFESFVRLYHEGNAGAENAKGSATGGFGLGLAIVKRIMQWHEGDAEFAAPQVLTGARAQIKWPKPNSSG